MEDEKYGKEFLGTRLGFPVMADPATGRFRASSYEEDIKEAIYIILMTKKGHALCVQSLDAAFMILPLLHWIIRQYLRWKNQ